MLATHAFDLVHHFIYLGSLPDFFSFLAKIHLFEND